MQPHYATTAVLLVLSVWTPVEGGKFEKYDQPKTIDLSEEDFAHLILENDITTDEHEHEHDCIFSAAHKHHDQQHDNDDWQIIELPHGHHQFDHVDHLPLVNTIDYNWPTIKVRRNKHPPSNKKQEFAHNDGWKKPSKGLDARKLFLRSKFHHKSKLPPPAQHIIYEQPSIIKRPVLDELTVFDQIQHQQPIVGMFKSLKTVNNLNNLDQINELSQQQDLLVQLEKDHPPTAAVIVENPKTRTTLDMIELNYGGKQMTTGSNLSQIPTSGRVRESFQAAAELAKQLELRSSNGSEEPRRDNGNENSVEMLNFTSSSRSDLNSIVEGWDLETTRADTNSTVASSDSLTELSPKYLGFGQIHKTNNTRSTTQQARLSCSFGLDQEQDGQESGNVTISVSCTA